MKLLISPHNDDETLFSAFTILQHRPHILIVYDSYTQPARGFNECSLFARRAETVAAMRELWDDFDPETELTFLGLSDADPVDIFQVSSALAPYLKRATQIWCPAFQRGGHDQHNAVANAVGLNHSAQTFAHVYRYATYVRGRGKTQPTQVPGHESTIREVPPANGDHIRRKLRALACYKSQLDMTPGLGCWPWFMGDLKEYQIDE